MRRVCQNQSLPVLLICVVLLLAAGVIGFFSGNLMPREIETPQVEAEKIAESTTVKPTVDEQFDELQESVGALINIVKEVPQFFYLMGTKIFAPETVGPNESNVFSVAKI